MGEQGVDDKAAKIIIPRIDVEGMRKASAAETTFSSVPSSPRATLLKQSSAKLNCLCSPTTHVGSFRCRYHRNNATALTRNSISVGSKLSELADNKITNVSDKPTGICDAVMDDAAIA